VATFALSALGVDRPGIVAAVAEVLVRHGVNVEDSQMSILGGNFGMVLILRAPEGVEFSTLRSQLEQLGEQLGLEAVTLSEVADAATERPEPTHAITVYGADHPGIVHAVAAAIARADINITNLTTRLVSEEQPLYVMVLEVAAPEGIEPERVLAPVADEQQVEVTIRSVEAATL
jgi:glycine cleavage system transcriptional repressor